MVLYYKIAKTSINQLTPLISQYARIGAIGEKK